MYAREGAGLPVLCLFVLFIALPTNGKTCNDDEPCLGDRPRSENGCCPARPYEACGPDALECDSELGFECVTSDRSGSGRGVCQGKYKLQQQNIRYKQVTLSWIDFKPENYTLEYAILRTTEYSSAFSSWTSIQYGDLPKATVTGLSPNTLYFFRVAIWKDASTETYGEMSETIMVKTVAGCEHNGQVRAIGYRYEDCEQRCTCFENGSLICTTRCPEIERPNNQECRLNTSQDDSCCQIMVCQPPTDGHCEYEGVVYENSEHFETDCLNCTCADGEMDCIQECEKVMPSEDCPVPFDTRIEGDCCPKWTCTNDCLYDGIVYNDGDTWNVACRQCTCMDKQITCPSVCEESTEEELECERQTSRPDPNQSCCTIVECLPTATECIYLNETFEIGAIFISAACEHCVCRSDGVACFVLNCPELSLPEESTVCPHPQIHKGECCDVLMCSDPITENYNVVTKLSITITTGTSFTLAFDQPINKGLKNFTLGYELHFTDNKDLNKWDHTYVPLSSIQNENGGNENVITQDDVSETTESPDAYSLDDVIYVKVQGLKENTTYYIKVRILVEWEDVKKLLMGSGTREERSADDRNKEAIALEEMEEAPLTIIPYSNTVSITTLLSDKICIVGGTVMREGQRFNRTCREECKCEGGELECVDTCPEDQVIVKPSKSCPNPQLENVIDGCCPKWTCYPEEGGCLHGKLIMANGERIRDECKDYCTCTDGTVTCVPVCTDTQSPHPGCMEIIMENHCCKMWSCPPEKRPFTGIEIKVSLKFPGMCLDENDFSSKFRDNLIVVLRAKNLCSERDVTNIDVCNRESIIVTCPEPIERRKREELYIIVIIVGSVLLNESSNYESTTDILQAYMEEVRAASRDNDFVVTFDSSSFRPAEEVSISLPAFVCDTGFMQSNDGCVEVTIIPKPGSNETLDLKLHAVDISSVSAVLSWDPVSSLKLQYVTGVLLEYQQHLVDLVWMSSGMLNVTTTSHQLYNLQPTREYLARLVLTVSMEGVNRINLTSISLKTAEKDNAIITFDIVITAVSVTTTSVVVEWNQLSQEAMHLVNHLVIVYHSRDSDDVICNSVTPDVTSYTINDLNATSVYIIHIDIVLNNGSTIMTSEVTLKQEATDAPPSALPQSNRTTIIAVSVVLSVAVVVVIAAIVMVLFCRKNFRQWKLKCNNSEFENKTFGLQLNEDTSSTIGEDKS